MVRSKAAQGLNKVKKDYFKCSRGARLGLHIVKRSRRIIKPINDIKIFMNI